MPATKTLIQPNAQNEYKVDASDLPLACPMPEMYLWNSHPRVYLAIEETGWAKCPYCSAEFERLRVDLLMRCVRRETLRTEVRNMRERMRKELSKARPGSGKFDIKQDAGGTADIEFLAQYWALLHAGTHPPVVMFADTIRQLESVASADLVPQQTVDVLTHAYRKYRERAHHLSLEKAEALVPAEEFAADRAAVTAIWNATMGD